MLPSTLQKFVFCIVIVAGFQTKPVWADDLSDRLAKQSSDFGEINIISSTATDPVGVEGLWGLKGNFIVDNDCKTSFDAIADVQNHPNYSKKIKDVKRIEKTDTTITVDYTEGAYGFQTTSRLLWNFNSGNSPLSMTCKTIGEKDHPSWVELKFQDVGHPDYCEVDVHMFADVSYLPNFIMNWMSSIAAEELANTYRDIIKGFAETKK